jgi:hypothetical protein
VSLDIYIGSSGGSGGRPFRALYETNCTHNLRDMWHRAGVYDTLYGAWCPAGELIPALEASLAEMEANPEVYRALAPSNGWGTYEGALEFLCDLLNACRRYPHARASSCR